MRPCKLIHGDFYSEYKKFEQGSFDLILTDPPYNRLEQAGEKWDTKIDWNRTEGIFSKLIKPTGWVIMFCDFLLAVELVNIFCHKLEFHGIHIWHKPGGTPAGKMHPIHDTEHILLFRQKGVHVSDMTFNPKVRSGTPYRKVNTSPEFAGRRQKKSAVNENVTGDRWGKTLLSGPSKPNQTKAERSHDHPTPKPINVLRELLLIYSNKNDLVLDGFGGVFSTALACIETRRRVVGVEQDESYFQQGRERVRRAQMQGDLFKKPQEVSS